MLKSMTGYGRSQQLADGMNITVEIKSVNHRYFEFSSRLPRNYGFLDEKLKSFFNGKLTRGKMECYVQIEAVEEPDTVISLNHSLVKGYLDVIYQDAVDVGVGTIPEKFYVDKRPKEVVKCAIVYYANNMKHFVAITDIEETTTQKGVQDE